MAKSNGHHLKAINSRAQESKQEAKEGSERSEMGVSLLQAVAALVSTCMRRLQRAASRMGAGKASRAVVLLRKAFSLPSAKGKGARGWDKMEGGVWRKEILMGERCQPLDFSGVIDYDTDDRRLAQPPRSPMRSPLPASVKLATDVGIY